MIRLQTGHSTAATHGTAVSVGVGASPGPVLSFSGPGTKLKADYLVELSNPNIITNVQTLDNKHEIIVNLVTWANEDQGQLKSKVENLYTSATPDNALARKFRRESKRQADGSTDRWGKTHGLGAGVASFPLLGIVCEAYAYASTYVQQKGFG